MTRSPRWRRNQRLKCDCGGYWFPHRRGGGLCYHSDLRDFNEARRDGATLQEAMQLLTPEQLQRLFPVPEDHT